LSTGFVPEGWAVSINARGNPAKGTAEGLANALKLAAEGAQVLPIFVRAAMDAQLKDGGLAQLPDRAYTKAFKFYTTNPLIMPGYIIVAGTAKAEGAILTRNETDGDIYTLFSKEGKGPAGGDWYDVQTNTDHWVPTAKKSRRTTAHNAMEAIGSEGIDLIKLWQVLDTPPVYNGATIHTDLTCPATGEYRTYKRHGPF
jgi:hypothetical protein